MASNLGHAKGDALGRGFLLGCEARCWKLVKERFVLPCKFEWHAEINDFSKCNILRKLLLQQTETLKFKKTWVQGVNKTWCCWCWCCCCSCSCRCVLVTTPIQTSWVGWGRCWWWWWGGGPWFWWGWWGWWGWRWWRWWRRQRRWRGGGESGSKKPSPNVWYSHMKGWCDPGGGCSLTYSRSLEDSFRDKNENQTPNSKIMWSRGADLLFRKDTGKGVKRSWNLKQRHHKAS